MSNFKPRFSRKSIGVLIVARRTGLSGGQKQGRSPCLDLDSVYGKPSKNGGESPRPDGVRMMEKQDLNKRGIEAEIQR